MRMLRPIDCARKIGVSRTTLHRWQKRQGFPKAFRLGANTVAFDESEIDTWLASRRSELDLAGDDSKPLDRLDAVGR